MSRARLPPPLGRADGVLDVEFYPSTCIARARVAVVADMRVGVFISSVMLTLIPTHLTAGAPRSSCRMTAWLDQVPESSRRLVPWLQVTAKFRSQQLHFDEAGPEDVAASRRVADLTLV